MEGRGGGQSGEPRVAARCPPWRRAPPAQAADSGRCWLTERVPVRSRRARDHAVATRTLPGAGRALERLATSLTDHLGSHLLHQDLLESPGDTAQRETEKGNPVLPRRRTPAETGGPLHPAPSAFFWGSPSVLQQLTLRHEPQHDAGPPKTLPVSRGTGKLPHTRGPSGRPSCLGTGDLETTGFNRRAPLQMRTSQCPPQPRGDSDRLARGCPHRDEPARGPSYLL